MPAKSKAQQHLMAAAKHGATFPMAKQVQRTMSLGQMADFARGSTAGKPVHVSHPHKNLGGFLHPKKGK